MKLFVVVAIIIVLWIISDCDRPYKHHHKPRVRTRMATNIY